MACINAAVTNKCDDNVIPHVVWKAYVCSYILYVLKGFLKKKKTIADHRIGQMQQCPYDSSVEISKK